MTTWEEIRDEIAGMLADGQPLENVITKLEERKNEMAKANLLKAMDEMKNPLSLTNEEWLCSLPTEEKARFICNLMKGDDLYLGVMSARDMIKDELNHGKDGKFVIYEWLKEKHE